MAEVPQQPDASNAWDAHKALMCELASATMASSNVGEPGSEQYGQFLSKLTHKLGDAIVMHQGKGYDAKTNALPDLLAELASLGKCSIGSAEFGVHLAKIEGIVRSLRSLHAAAVHENMLSATPLLFGPRQPRVPKKKGGKS